MKLTIKYFGLVAELTGKKEETRELAASTSVTGLKHALESFYPNLSGKSYQVAIDQTLVEAGWEINADCEVAILPPFAGG